MSEVLPTIFVVDDDPAVLDSVSLVLRQLDKPVKCFSSANEFLEKWGGPRPGCLVLDVRMPGIGGIELQKMLSSEHPYFPIVIVTGHATVPMSVESVQEGAFDFLEKPYEPAVLRRTVASALDRAGELWEKWLIQAEFKKRRASLSPREEDVYALLLEGMENKQIAAQLGISPSTAEKHRLSVVRKMGTENPTQLLGQKFDATGKIQE